MIAPEVAEGVRSLCAQVRAQSGRIAAMRREHSAGSRPWQQMSDLQVAYAGLLAEANRLGALLAAAEVAGEVQSTELRVEALELHPAHPDHPPDRRMLAANDRA